ncbi:MAG: hypothetical protein QM689_12410 [Oscillospiraceae bacterium]
MKRFFSALIAVVILVTLVVPVPVATATDMLSVDVTYDGNGVAYIYGDGNYTFSGAVAGIVVSAGAKPTLTLNNVTVNRSVTSGACAFYVDPTADVTLILVGENTIKSGSYSAGIEVPVGAKLTVSEQSTGALYAIGGDSGAGIGGKYGESCGTVSIYGGYVAPEGGSGAAGIGGGQGGAGGAVTITGGTVTAYSDSSNVKGIGCGFGASTNGTAVIDGGSVSTTFGATPKNSAGQTLSLVSVNTNEIMEEFNHVSICGAAEFSCQSSLFKGLYLWMPENGSAYYKYGGVYYYLDTTGLPVPASALTVLDVTKASIVIGDGTVSGKDASGNPITIADNRGYKIIGITRSYNISVTGGAHNIVLSDVGVNMQYTATPAAFRLTSGVTVSLFAMSVNAFESGENEAGIIVPAGAKLNYYAESGKGMIVEGGEYGAGLGGEYGSSAGTIVINGGTIVANGGIMAAGIGGGYLGNGGTITINDGAITTTGGNLGAGIGSGANAFNAGTITINGGTVTATGGMSSAGIGSGTGSIACGSGTVTITGGIVTANSETNAASIGGGADGFITAVNISGGTVKTGYGSAYTGLGNGRLIDAQHLIGSTAVTITGGSVNASGINVIPTNGTAWVYPTRMVLPNDMNTAMKSLVLTQQADTYDYGIKDMYTDGTGTLYFWLPITGDGTTTAVGTAKTAFSGYHGKILSGTTLANPAYLRLDHRALTVSLDSSFVYGTAIAPSVSGLYVDETVTYTYTGTGATTYAASTAVPTDTGTYKVTAVSSGTTVCDPATAETTFAITEAAMTGVSATGYDGAYDGAAHSINVTVTAPAGATITYSEDGINYAATNPAYTAEGDYTVYYKVTKANYADVTGSAAVHIASVTMTGVSATDYSGTYDGSSHSISVNVTSPAGATITYSTDETDYSATNPAYTAEGDYTVYYKVEKTNYTTVTGSATVTITAATLTGVSASGYSGAYDGAAHSITVNNGPVGAEVSYSTTENGDYNTAQLSYTNVGTHTVYYKVTKDNYTTATGSATVNITAATVTETTIAGITAPAAGDVPDTTAAAGTQFTVSAVSWTDSPAKFTRNRAYTATFVLTTGANYTFSGLGADAFVVSGADSTVFDAATGRITAVFPKTAPITYVGAQKRLNPVTSRYELRLVAVVDSLEEANEIGFAVSGSADMTRGNTTFTKSTAAYLSIDASTEVVFPTAYHGKYFVTITITGITEEQLDDAYYVKAYWDDAQREYLTDVRTILLSGLPV